MTYRKKIIIVFSLASIILIFVTLAGIPIYKPDYTQYRAIIWFTLTGLAAISCMIIVIYNIVKSCTENIHYSPLAYSTNPPSYYDD